MSKCSRTQWACLAALLVGGSARAIDVPPPAEGVEEVRLNKETVRALLSPARQVSVVGSARASVAPDLAEMSIGVTTTKATAPDAVESNNRAMAKLIEALKRGGVAGKDVQTSQVSISPQYATPPQPKPGEPPVDTASKVVGYEVTNTVRVTIRDLTKIGTLLDAATKAGANQVYGVSFRLDDRQAVLTGLRSEAFDAAKAKAALYAKRAGMELGFPVSISESDDSSPPAPQSPMGGMMAPAPMAPGSPMPINPAEQEISLSVSVSYELKPPR